MDAINNTELLKKLKTSLANLEAASKQKNSSSGDTSLDKLNEYAENIVEIYTEMEDKYKELSLQHFALYEGLIGDVITNYYVELAYKYISQVQEMIETAKVIRRGGRLDDLLSSLLLYLNKGETGTNAVNIIKESIGNILSELMSSLNENDVMCNVDENGEIVVYDTRSSKFTVKDKIKSGYVKFVDVSGYNLTLKCSIYGYYDDKNDMDDIYLTCPDLSLTNVHFVKVTKRIQLLWFVWDRVVYKSVTSNPEDPDEYYGLLLRFKKNWITGYNSKFTDAITKVKLQKGYAVDNVAYYGKTEEDVGKVYTRYRKDDNDEYSVDLEKVINSMKNTTINDNSLKDIGSELNENWNFSEANKETLPIQFKLTDTDGDSIKVGSYSSKFNTYCDNVERTVTFTHDTSTLDYTNQDTLSDFVEVTVSIGSGLEKTTIQFDSDSAEETDYGIRYKYTGTYSPNTEITSATDVSASSLGNNIPLELYFEVADASKKANTVDTDTSTDDAKNTGTVNTTAPDKKDIVKSKAKTVKIELASEKESDSMIIRENEIYGWLGCVFCPSTEHMADYKVTDISSDPMYLAAYGQYCLGVEPMSAANIAYLRNSLLNLYDEYVAQIFAILNKAGAACQTMTSADGIRQIYDSNYADDYYSEIKSTLLNIYMTISQISAVTDLKDIIAENKTDIDEIVKSIYNCYSTSHINIAELLEATALADDFLEAYTAVFDATDKFQELFNSLQVATSIYQGDTSYSEVLNIANTMFIGLNAGRYDFTTWCSRGTACIHDNLLFFVRLYLIRILLCRLSPYANKNRKEFQEYALDVDLKLIKRQSIILLDDKPNKALDRALAELDSFERGYGFTVQRNLNNETLSSILLSLYPSLYKINQIYISDTDLNQLDYQLNKLNPSFDQVPIINIMASKLIQVYFIEKADYIEDKNSFANEFWNKCYEMVDNTKNIRSAFFIIALSEAYKYLGEATTETTYPDYIKNMLSEYISLRSLLFDPDELEATFREHNSELVYFLGL